MTDWGYKTIWSVSFDLPVDEKMKGGKLTEKIPADQAAVMAWQYADAFVKELGKQ